MGKVLPWITIRTVIDGAIRGHLLETTVDSVWPCSAIDAKRAKIQLPPEQIREDKPELTSNPMPSIVYERLPQKRIAGAYLDIGEMQDLTEQLGNLTRIAVGQNLAFYVRVELSGKENQQVPDEVVEKINQVLGEISEKLEFS